MDSLLIIPVAVLAAGIAWLIGLNSYRNRTKERMLTTLKNSDQRARDIFKKSVEDYSEIATADLDTYESFNREELPDSIKKVIGDCIKEVTTVRSYIELFITFSKWGLFLTLTTIVIQIVAMVIVASNDDVPQAVQTIYGGFTLTGVISVIGCTVYSWMIDERREKHERDQSGL